MLFLISLHIYKVFTATQSNMKEEFLDSFSESGCESSSEFVCKPLVPKVEIKRCIEKPRECRKCLFAFQQIEFALRRHTLSETALIKDHNIVLGKDMADAMIRATAKVAAEFLVLKAGVFKLTIDSLRYLYKDLNSAIGKIIEAHIDEFRASNVVFLRNALGLYATAVTSLTVLSDAEITAQLSSPLSSFNVKVSAIIAAAGAAAPPAQSPSALTIFAPAPAALTLKKLVIPLYKSIDNSIDRFKLAVIEKIGADWQPSYLQLLALYKLNIDELLKTKKVIILKYQDTLIAALYQSNLRLFELVRFLLIMCREELTGVKNEITSSFNFPSRFPCYGNNRILN